MIYLKVAVQEEVVDSEQALGYNIIDDNGIEYNPTPKNKSKIDKIKEEIEKKENELKIAKKVGSIHTGFDLYSNVALPEILKLEATEFVKIPTRKFPSSWNGIIVSVSTENSVKIKHVHEVMVRYGLSRLKEIINDQNNKTNIYNKCLFLKRATKFVEIPSERYGEMFSLDEGDTGLASKTFYVSEETLQMCVQFASDVFCTVDSIIKSSIMISMNESGFIREENLWFVNKYGLSEDKMRSHLKTKNEHIRLLLRTYTSSLVNVYNGYIVKIMTKKEVNIKEVDELWNILKHLIRIKELKEEVVNYKDLFGKSSNVQHWSFGSSEHL